MKSANSPKLFLVLPETSHHKKAERALAKLMGRTLVDGKMVQQEDRIKRFRVALSDIDVILMAGMTGHSSPVRSNLCFTIKHTIKNQKNEEYLKELLLFILEKFYTRRILGGCEEKIAESEFRAGLIYAYRKSKGSVNEFLKEIYSEFFTSYYLEREEEDTELTDDSKEENDEDNGEEEEEEEDVDDRGKFVFDLKIKGAKFKLY